MRFELKSPVTRDGRQIAAVTMRTPTQADRVALARSFAGLSGSKAQKGRRMCMLMVARLCDLPPAVVRKMAAADVLQIGEAAAAALKGGGPNA